MSHARLLLLAVAVGCRGDEPHRPAVARASPAAEHLEPVIKVDAPPRDLGGRNTFRGHITLGTQPFAGRALELCPKGQTSSQLGSWCTGALPRLETRTDANGDLVFEHLVDDDYVVYTLEAPYRRLVFQFSIGGGTVVEQRGETTLDYYVKSPPAAPDPSAARALRGRLVHHGVPLDHMPLELCAAHGWIRTEPTPCWNSPHRDVARTDADGAFVFLHAPPGDVQIVMLEMPYYPRVVFVGAAAVDVGTKRVTTTDEHEVSDDDTAEQWPDVSRRLEPRTQQTNQRGTPALLPIPAQTRDGSPVRPRRRDVRCRASSGSPERTRP